MIQTPATLLRMQADAVLGDAVEVVLVAVALFLIVLFFVLGAAAISAIITAVGPEPSDRDRRIAGPRPEQDAAES